MLPRLPYDLLVRPDILQCRRRSVNIQTQFKFWYNKTFPHEHKCPHYLKYESFDGSSCTYAHRPYKSAANQWSLSKAIAYTFDEQFDDVLEDIHRCTAVTKLAHVVTEK